MSYKLITHEFSVNVDDIADAGITINHDLQEFVVRLTYKTNGKEQLFECTSITEALGLLIRILSEK